MRKLLSYEEISEFVSADFETGKLFWKSRKENVYKKEAVTRRWNSIFAGKEAFTGMDGQGYFCSTILLKRYAAHRVIWILAYGYWPQFQIDHINGIRSDNRLINLRDVPNSENGKNKKLPSNNKSGVPGVFWNKNEKKWKVSIRSNNRSFYLGSYEDFQMAVSLRKDAERKFGFHENNGRPV